MAKVPFILTLKKVGRLLGWKQSPSSGISDNLEKQKATLSSQFGELHKQALVQFAEQVKNVYGCVLCHTGHIFLLLGVRYCCFGTKGRLKSVYRFLQFKKREKARNLEINNYC